ncbi:MAG TPA: tetratricopeptide repeat protein [Kofleriaceae bacterium]|nr:tetratricopeptide repeat protein [Kofleriaceae bacterium]
MRVTAAMWAGVATLFLACGAPSREAASPAPKKEAATRPETKAAGATADDDRDANASGITDADAALDRGIEHNRGWRFDEAARELEAALKLFEAASPRDELKIIDTMSWLGRAYRGLGRWHDAEIVLRRRLAIAEDYQDDTERSAALSDLAQVISESGDPRRAIPMFEEAIAIDERIGRGDDDTGKMARIHNLALALGDVGDERGAIKLLERVLVADKQRDPVSVSTANTMHNLALNYRDAGELDKAEDLFESAIRIITAKEGGDHPRLVPSLSGLAGTLKLAGKYDEAELLYRQVLSITTKGRLDGRAIALADLGDLEVQVERFEEARVHLDEAIELLHRLYPDPKGHAEIVRTLIKRTAAHLGLEDVRAAERDTAAAIEMASEVYEGYDDEIARKVDWLGDIWDHAGHAKRAKSLRAQADKLRRP